MNPAERGPVILPFFAEAERQSGKASNAGSHAEILALDN